MEMIRETAPNPSKYLMSTAYWHQVYFVASI